MVQGKFSWVNSSGGLGKPTVPVLKKIWVAGPPLMGSIYPLAHQQASSTMACLYGQGAQCCWGKVTNTCVGATWQPNNKWHSSLVIDFGPPCEYLLSPPSLILTPSFHSPSFPYSSSFPHSPFIPHSTSFPFSLPAFSTFLCFSPWKQHQTWSLQHI